jgi:3D-(3,5/4)-trihydroxycyclohexane-1,2-dione acylhydrolase (decyclizing)
VLQQIEAFGDPTVSVNDCFRPVSRWWDRVTRPEQILESLPQALRVLTDPANCGPVTLALPQDVQTEAYDYHELFRAALLEAASPPARCGSACRGCRRTDTRQGAAPLIVAVAARAYALAGAALADFTARHGVPVAETPGARTSAPPRCTPRHWTCWTISASPKRSSRTVSFQPPIDFTTASRSLFRNPELRVIQLNIATYDAVKHSALPLVADAQAGLGALGQALAGWTAPSAWAAKAHRLAAEWNDAVTQATAESNTAVPSDAQVLGAVNRAAAPGDIVVCAAGGLPGELHKLWRCREPGAYHVEYGYSCMGYEIAGGLGVKLAMPEREVWVLVGDGSYLMMNSEIATSIALGKKLNIVLLDNGGFGCIDRLQRACGSASFNNLFPGGSGVDFAAHAVSLGADACKAVSLAELESALPKMRAAQRLGRCHRN